jgi:hypothetical protein
MAGVNALEVWLAGTPGQLGAALEALRAAGFTPAYLAPRQAMSGPDAGRFTQYIRANIPSGGLHP